MRDGGGKGAGEGTRHCQEEWASRDIFYLHNDNASYSADDDDYDEEEKEEEEDDYTPAAITQTHPMSCRHSEGVVRWQRLEKRGEGVGSKVVK